MKCQLTTMTKLLVIVVLIIVSSASTSFAQTPSPSPTPTDDRGLGIRSSTSASGTQGNQQAKEAKPELVLQTGYSDLFGATRLVFSPDGRLLATTSFRTGAIKLWETATSRKLRELTTGTATANNIAPPIAFSRDNRFVAAAAGDNSTKVWEISSGREVQTLAGPQSSAMAAFGVFFIAFTPDNRVVTISDAVRVWDLFTGQALRTFEASLLSLGGFNGTDGGTVLSPDGTQLTLYTQEDVRSIDLATGKEVRRVKLPDDRVDVVQLSFDPNGNLLAAGIVNKHFKLWNLTNKNSKELTPTQKDFSQVKFSRDGQLLALTENYVARIWNTATGSEVTQLKIPNSGVFADMADAFSAFTDDGKKIATGGFGTETIIWETETGKQISKMSGRTNLAYNVAFSADGMQLFVGGRTRWDLRTGRGLRVSPVVLEKTYPIQSPDSRVLAVIKPNSSVLTLIEAATGRQLFELKPSGDPGIVERARFSSDGAMIAATYGPRVDMNASTGSLTRGSSVKIWDVKSGTELQSLVGGDVQVEADFSEDGKVLGTIGSMGEIALWDTRSGSKLRDLASSPMKGLTDITKAQQTGRMPVNMPNMADMSAMMTNVLGTMSAGTMGRKVTSLAFTPDGRMLATGGVESKSNLDLAAMMSGAMNQKRQKNSKQSQDPMDIMKDLKVEAIAKVQLWDVATGQEIASIKGHGRAVTKVAFSRDGKLLATGSNDNTITIWDVATQRELKTLTGHSASLDSMDFSPDNRLLATAGEDGATFLWDANTGEHLLTLISLDDGGEWMVVNPQGLFDGTPVTWNQILWRYNQETFNVAPIEWFFNEFYYPGLLSDVFFGKRPRVTQDISKKDRRQPIVKLSIVGETPATGIASRAVKLKIDITDAPADRENAKGSGARDVRLFRNGSLVKVWHGDVLNGQASVSLEQEIAVTAGPNRLVAYAFNKDNVKSKDAPLVFTGAASLKRKGVAYVIAVGINDYQNNQYNLKYAVADAQSFGDEMRARQIQIGEFERVEVISLLNENATKANILAVLRRLGGAPGPPSLRASALDSLKRVEPEDSVIIYYAGHGTAQAARFYLIPHDLGYTGERTKLTEQGLNTILAHSISDVELEDAVEGLDAGHLLLIIDACNSGQALEAEEKRRGPMNSKGLAQLAYEKGMYILTAAQSFQAALEAAQLGHGLLTYALVEEGLKTSVADNEPKDGVLIAREWLDFATERVPQMQTQKMNEGRGVGLAIAFTEGEKDIQDPQKRSVQRPRVFYRREMETNPLIIAKP
jgi:WD40 repeat protein/uncharacterized caspase-like protein